MVNGRHSDVASRTKRFDVGVVRLYCALPKSTVGQVMGRQVLRSGTSVGAHYREACRAKSDADFISKLEGALQELDESAYWLELLEETRVVPKSDVAALKSQADSLIATLVTIVKGVKARKSK
jgi:four helix bundle protein